MHFDLNIERSFDASGIDKKTEDMFSWIASAVRDSVLMNFNLGGRPQTWPPLKKDGKPSFLFQNGGLIQSVVKFSGIDFAEVQAGEGLKYAWIHQKGGIINHPGTSNGFGRHIQIPPHAIEIPRRTYMLFQQQDIEQIRAKYINTFLSFFNAEGRSS